MGTRLVRVTRDVAIDEEHNYADRAVKEGEYLFTFIGATYGCVDDCGGIALSEVEGKYPFFEFPRDAIEVAETEGQRCDWEDEQDRKTAWFNEHVGDLLL